MAVFRVFSFEPSSGRSWHYPSRRRDELEPCDGGDPRGSGGLVFRI